MGDATKSYSLSDAANWHRVEGAQSLAQSYFFIFFFKLFHILVLQDSSFFPITLG